MNRIKFIAKAFAVGLGFVFLHLGLLANSDEGRHYTSISAQELKMRIESLASPVEMRYTPEVHSIVDTYIRTYRKGSERILGRGYQYFPIYEQVFEQHAFPADLKYLSVVESSLKPTVVSPSGAVGLWQFISSTAKLYGLTVNSTVDERKDLMRSTEAAVQYLKDLHARFGDWSLALAAYNCGPGGVNRAKRAYNASEGVAYWELRDHLPKETRRYVPKFVAVSYLMNYYHQHGLQPSLEERDESFAVARVDDYISFNELSKKTGLSLREINEYNPAYLKSYIPKSDKGYYLTLPASKMYEYLAITGQWDKLVYQPNGDDPQMHSIYLYGSMKRRLMNLRKLDQLPTRSNSEMKVQSQKPVGQEVPQPNSPHAESDTWSQARNKYKYFTMNKQQSIIDVAEIFDASVEDIIAVNKIDLNNPPVPGTTLLVPVL